MAKIRSKDLARAADQRIIEAAEYFTLIRFIGRTPSTDGGVIERASLRERTEFHSATLGGPALALEAARVAKSAMGRDDQGRPGIIYAVGAGGITVHVE